MNDEGSYLIGSKRWSPLPSHVIKTALDVAIIYGAFCLVIDLTKMSFITSLPLAAAILAIYGGRGLPQFKR
jgi:hypothetical protein